MPWIPFGVRRGASRGLWRDVDTFPLDVPYYTQLDSEVWGQAERSCFSSSMAMALEYVDPEGIDGDDDWYLREVLKRGDTVSSTAQVETARALGYSAEFRMDGTEKLLTEILDSGTPIPVGILHKGHVTSLRVAVATGLC